jgi:hypothetical protein
VTAVVNISSANNIVFSRNNFSLTKNSKAGGPNQFPISVHDASNVYVAGNNLFSADWLSAASCARSRLLALQSPPPKVTAVPPIACGIAATTSNLIVEIR